MKTKRLPPSGSFHAEATSRSGKVRTPISNGWREASVKNSPMDAARSGSEALPKPLPRISSPELRNVEAASDMFAPALWPIWM